jgi:acyl carrier protein
MINTLDELVTAINTWLREKQISTEVGADDDIIDSRIVDSLQFVSMIVHIETLSHSELSIDELSVDDFRTIRKIYESCFVKTGDLV